MKKLMMIATLVAGCSDSAEAVRVDLPVTTAPPAFGVATTDLGYAVTLSAMEMAVTAVQFTIEGEMHDDAQRTIARPHPGHASGGEVTGELPGDHVFVWNGLPHDPLGTGTLITGDYHGANFGIRADASLGGHAIHIAGTVAKGGETHPFDMLFDVEADTTIIGAVFEDTITESSTETLGFAFYPTDRAEGDTAFDGVDFFTLPRPGDAIEIRPGSTAHNIIRRAITTHDHYGVELL